jgi:F-type H+-transporting ATPase subunit alpha
MNKSDTLISTADITKSIQQQIEKSQSLARMTSTGKVTSAGDGVAVVSGLSDAMLGELVEFSKQTYGLVLNLKQNEVNVVIFGDYTNVREGDVVSSTGAVLTIPASYNLIGRVLDPLMKPIDGAGNIKKDTKDQVMALENIAPGVIKRQDVRTPLQTGIKMIDALLPIGRGQRELIIGDRGTGKTAIAIDAIINQAKINTALEKNEKRVICIYVAIGQKQAKVAQVVGKLAEESALTNTIIISASASDSASLQYLAPFAATAVGEFFMQQGEDVLIIYDDLTKHAWAYRQLSLLLRRPSGREAYPGDIFYLHSRLLERSARMADRLGGGSMTALPIIETQAGDISAYIPTNVISITDGQIFLEPDIFYSGVRPAVSIGLSVSRVGGDAQMKAMKQVAGKLKLDLAQFRELAAFAQFGSDLDESTKKRLDRGKVLTELLKQPQYKPLSVDEQIASIWLGMQGYLDNLAINEIQDTAEEFIRILGKHKAKPLTTIRKEKVITPETEKILETEADNLIK